MYSPDKRDVFPLILARLSPREILNWSFTAKCNYSCLNEQFWRTLIIARWGSLEEETIPHLEYKDRYQRDINLLFNSIKFNFIDIVQKLLQRGIKVDQQDAAGLTALHYACDCGHDEISQELIKYWTDFTIRDRAGFSLLHYACSKQRFNPEILQKLISMETNINHQNKNGHTALHLASLYGSYKTVEMLISVGADRNIRNNQGFTALDLVKIFERSSKIIQLLQR